MNKDKKVDLIVSEQLNHISKGLRQLRLEKGFTNYEYLAYEIGMSRSQYGAYENGKNMNLSTLIKILNHFDMTLFNFFDYLQKNNLEIK